MPFDVKAFKKEKFEHRTEDVPVPDMKQFFGENEPAVWRVRGLEGKEFGRCNEAADRTKDLSAIIDGLVSSGAKEKADAIRSIIGIDNETPKDVAKRLHMLVLGSVEPLVDLDIAKKLCKTFPIEFYQLTNAITRLTGMGQVPGKSKPSGKTTECAPPSPSVTPGGDSSLR